MRWLSAVEDSGSVDRWWPWWVKVGLDLGLGAG
jgi:hypothetical protein